VSYKFKTKDYAVFVGQHTGMDVPPERRNAYFVKHIVDEVIAGDGNQLGAAIGLAVSLQVQLDSLDGKSVEELKDFVSGSPSGPPARGLN
jgi:hypothetical protein